MREPLRVRRLGAIAATAAILASLNGVAGDERTGPAGDPRPAGLSPGSKSTTWEAARRAHASPLDPAPPALTAAERELFALAVDGDARQVQKRLEQGARPNCRDENGRTALVEAAAAGNADVVRALLDNGADPKILGKDNFSALYWALFYKRTAAVKLLVERGADPGTMSVDIF